jgi:hypothetical protein
MKFEDAVQPNRKLLIEEKARRDANLADLRYPTEAARFPESNAQTYWDRIVHEGERAVYGAAYRQRIDRRLRTERFPCLVDDTK